MHTKTKLYVGTGVKNNGVVTVNVSHLNDSTKHIGYTIDDASAEPIGNYVEVFVGNGASQNGVVTRDWNHCNDSTESIGYFSLHPIPVNGTKTARKLYVGTGPHQNGVVSTSTMHCGESTEFFGYALPPD